MSNGTASGEGLARVTYLPGVQPPGAASVSSAHPSAPPEPAWAPAPLTSVGPAESRPVAEAPTDVVPAPAEKGPSDKLRARAENVSMHALTRRGMSRWELERALRSRELDDDLIDEELERLERVGLIDDASLAETIVRTQHERKGLGRSALVAELRRRHIGQEHIDLALEQVDDDDEQARATELAIKRAPQLRSYDRETAHRRLSGFLLRKGYGGSVVRAAVDAALSGHGSSQSGVRFR